MGRVERRRCSGCWNGYLYVVWPDSDGGNSKAYSNCDNCGLPGDKPAMTIWNGDLIDHYVNHGNTWQSYAIGKVSE